MYRDTSSTTRETLIWTGIFKLIKQGQHSKHRTTQKMDRRLTKGRGF